MKISTILDQINSPAIALPEFQRGYVWNREQVRNLFESLYRGYPVGGLLFWETEAKTATARGENTTSKGIVNLLLDGQQRMTSIYGVVRGAPPKFFDGDERAFTGLHFHLGDETFAFYQHIKMQDDPLWIDVTELMQGGTAGVQPLMDRLPDRADVSGQFLGRLLKLLQIKEIALPHETITGEHQTLDVVVDIFNRVNSGGTKLSKGDLALARICAEWPEAREAMKTKLSQWADAGYSFTLDWLLRSVNTILTGEAKFSYLRDQDTSDLQNGLESASRHIDTTLNMIAGRLGLDHDRVFFGRFAVPVIVRYLDLRGGRLDEKERDKILFWFAQAGMWGRFSASTETVIDRDLAALEGPNGGLDALIEQLRLSQGGLRIEPDHFTGWSLGARFYPILYMLTRMGEACDWGTGLRLKANMLGRMARLEVHHIFPKSKLYAYEHTRAEVNAVANYCFLTKDTNLNISDRLPEEYFPEIEAKHPGALASQWIPTDPTLWKIERYLDFLEARKTLLAAEANKRFEELLHGDTQWLRHIAPVAVATEQAPIGGIESEDEEHELENLNVWVVEQNLPAGQISFDYADPDTGAHKAVFDLVWEDGLQPGLTEPVAVLLNEPDELLSLASGAGFRCFTAGATFRTYVENEILKLQAT